MRTIHMLIGIPGSGKTTYSNKLKDQLGCLLVSSDRIRQLNPKWEEARIFPEVYRVCAEELSNDRDVILDATNVDKETRAKVRKEIQKSAPNFSMVAYWFDTPWEECTRRVIKRNFKESELYLPPEVVHMYHKKFDVPSKEEGFLFIHRVISN